MADPHPPADLVRYVHDTRAAIREELLRSIVTTNNVLKDVRVVTERDGLSNRWVVLFRLNGEPQRIVMDAVDSLDVSVAVPHALSEYVAERLIESVARHFMKEMNRG